MAKSMTGYGRATATSDGRRVSIEARSVNHRFMEFNIKISGRIFQLDDRIRKEIKSRFDRGYFDVVVTIESVESTGMININEALLSDYMSQMSALAEKYGVEYPPSIGDLMQVRDIFTIADPEWSIDDAWSVVRQGLDDALDRLDQMRAAEGENIVADMKERLKKIQTLVGLIRSESAKGASERMVSLKERISKLVEEYSPDDDRIMQEAAILADRGDITEELTRLDSHLKLAWSTMTSSGSPIGRKMEFLLQEINRETNTIGAKTSSADITTHVVDLKSELERVREQVQNIE